MMMNWKCLAALASMAVFSGCAAGLVDDPDTDGVGSPAIPGPSNNGSGTGNGNGNGNTNGNGAGSGEGSAATKAPIDPICKVRPSYTEAGELAPLVASYDDSFDYSTATWDVRAQLEADPEQEMQLQIWHERGLFYSPEVATGTYSLAGESPANCSFCIFVHADKVEGEFTKHYFAVAGDVHVDDVWDNTLDARFSNLLFQEYDPATELLVADSDCGITMESAEIKTAIPVAAP